MRRRAVLALTLLCVATVIVSCANKTEESKPKARTFAVHFESISEVETVGGSINGEPRFDRGIVGNGFYLSNDSKVSLPIAPYFNVKGGCLEFWIQPRKNWNDYKTYLIMKLGTSDDFAIYKDSYRNELMWLLGGEVIINDENPILGEYKELIWGADWHQLCLCWGELGTDKAWAVMFIDGVERAKKAGFIRKPDFEGLALNFGATDMECPNVIIDELTLFKYPLTADDVLARYFEKKPWAGANIAIYPTPKPIGFFAQEALEISEPFTFAVPSSWIDRNSDALNMIVEKFSEAYGFEPQVVKSNGFEPKDSFAVITWKNQPLYASMRERWSIGLADENQDSEEYWLEIRPEGIAIVGATERGAFYGLTTFLQMLSLFEDAKLPALSMVDYPYFEARGVHIFAEPLTDQMKSLIRFLSALKLNHVVVESAGFFKLEEDETTKEELLELFDFIRDHQMEPIPELQSMGHAIHIIKLCQQRFGIDCSEAGSRSYCPCEPTVYEGVMFPAIEQTIQYFAPKKIHFGHDEVMTINEDERCQSWNMTNAELFAYDINKLYEHVKSVDPKVEFWIWADMLSPLSNGAYMGTSGAIDMIPKDIKLLLWTYTNIPGFTYLFGFTNYLSFQQKGFSYIGCPGENAYIGALEWAKVTSEMKGEGLLDVIRTTLPPNERWLALPITAEISWSYPLFKGIDKIPYDWESLVYELGGW